CASVLAVEMYSTVPISMSVSSAAVIVHALTTVILTSYVVVSAASDWTGAANRAQATRAGFKAFILASIGRVWVALAESPVAGPVGACPVPSTHAAPGPVTRDAE